MISAVAFSTSALVLSGEMPMPQWNEGARREGVLAGVGA